MPILEDRIRGRLGTYRVNVYDSDDFDRAPLSAELAGDVLIKYGELDRNPVRRILKSYVQLTFVDPTLDVYEEFSGGFKPERYIVEIFDESVNDVSWRGLVKEKARIAPFENRIGRETTTLNCYDGITEGRFSETEANETHSFTNTTLPVDSIYWLSRITKQLPIRGIGFSGDFVGGERLRSEVEMEFDTTAFDSEIKSVADVYDLTFQENGERWYPSPINTYQPESLYEAVRQYNQTTKSVLYKALQDAEIVWEECRQVGASGSFKTAQQWLLEDDYEMEEYPEFLHEVTEIIEERDEDGLRDLKSAGDILVEIGTDENILRIGPSSISYGSQPEQGGSVTYDTGGFGATAVNKNLDSYVEIRNIEDDTTASFTLHLPDLSPNDQIGIRLDWDEESVQRVDSVILNYNNADGDSVTENDPNNTFELVGPTTEQDISPTVEINLQSADFTTLCEINIKARYIDSSGNIVESLVFETNQQGIDPIRVEDVYDFNITGFDYFEGDVNEFDEFIDEPFLVQNVPLGIFSVNAPTYRHKIESMFNPAGTKTARFQVPGIYGPEYVHRINISGNDVYFIATGLAINLKTGITDVALVEVPPHTLK